MSKPGNIGFIIQFQIEFFSRKINEVLIGISALN